MASKKGEKCGVCKKLVYDQDNGLECEICSQWFHCKCQDVGEGLYKAINQFANDIHWFCKLCNAGADKILGVFAKLQSKVDKLEEEIVKLHRDGQEEVNKKLSIITNRITFIEDQWSNKLETAKSELLCIIDDKVEDMKMCVSDGLKENEPKWTDIVNKVVDNEFTKVKVDVASMQSSVDDTKKHFAEEKEKEQRANNIVIYNCIEERVADKSEWIKKERDFCLNFFNDILGVVVINDDIVRTVRLGKRTEEATSRPMLVQFKQRSIKNLIMQSLFKIKRGSEPYCKLVVCHDMTLLQRAECKRLVLEAKEKEANEGQGEWIYRVRGNPDNLVIVKLRKAM